MTLKNLLHPLCAWTSMAALLGGGQLSPLLAQERTASYYHHSLSLSLEAGNSPNGQRYYFSTYDGVFTWALEENNRYSGEIKPSSMYSQTYLSDYDAYYVPQSYYYGYGTLTLYMPSTDSDQDDLPDFIDIRKSTSLSISGSVREHQVGVGTATVNINGSLSRSANTYRGSYSVTSSEGVNVSGPFNSVGTQGTIRYNPTTRTVTISGVQFDGAVTVSGTATYQINSANQISVASFQMSNSTGKSTTVYAFTLNRRGNTYYGRFTMSDGNTATWWVDYEYNHILVIDNNDTDGDGIPDLSDTVNATPPVITQAPQSQTIGTGQTVSFSVQVSGVGPFTYQWLKDGVPIAGAISSTYTIAGVNPQHQGNYTVQVSNAGGTVTSAAATLTVLTPPQLTSSLQNLTVDVGQTAVFSVTASGSAPLSYQWYKDGNPITGATAASYQIASVRLEDGGRYSVRVSNSVGSAQSGEALLIVRAPPVFVSQPQTATVVRGMSLNLQASVQGGLPLSYVWYKNGAVLPGVSTSSYVVPVVDLPHAGAYYLVASNQFGRATSQVAQITVLEHGNLSRFAVELPTTNAYVGQPLNLRVTALDDWHNRVMTFNGAANVTAAGWTQVTTNMLGNVPHTASLNAAGLTLGYSFTPTNNLWVNRVRHYCGSQVSVWNQQGTLLFSQAVTSQNGVWRETALAQPVLLASGQTYRVGVYINTGQGYYRTDLSGSFPFGSIHSAYLGNGNVFPNTAASNLKWPLVDLVVTGDKLSPLPVTLQFPAQFSKGLLVGSITVGQPASAVQVRVEDGQGHEGTSPLFKVFTAVRLHSPGELAERQQIRSQGFRLRLALAPNKAYTIQYSEDLAQWHTWTNFTAAESSVELLDAAAAARPRRFYRALTQD
ncbi:immunoglobulin domain-containing protein [Fontisphaera persica]|uniref:immunoglobulin domain-containing protein n=1 Tax=Fontisphaera persica TaxID=2974023 RepID=UPI0024C01CD7|nr:immunoglobulin domain-containing protein [Fontisphaera persica]WCJ58414.1 immunoglobulin domain-containing protein [Fontisphaera persica]